MDSQQQQQQQWQQNQEGYAPSQPYDQSYYNNYYYTQQQDPYNQYTPYYNTQYENPHQNPPPSQPQYPHQPSSAPPQTTAPVGGSGVSWEAQVNNQQNGYYQAGPGICGDGNHSGTVNPVMAAAAMVLSQYSGTNGPVQQWNPGDGGGFHPGVGPRPMMGHGPANFGHGPMAPLHGGGPFRENFSRRPFGRGRAGPRSGSSSRGRGRGGPRFNRTHGASSSSPRLKPSDSDQAKVAGPTKKAWCELCKSECTTLEVLEQHKNGKRHQKNLQKLAKTEKKTEPSTIDNNNNPVPDSTNGENPRLENEPSSSINNLRQGTKRKAQNNRGTKRIKNGLNGPRVQKVVIPLICDICNVKCDTQEVFDRHVLGRKHVAKKKQYEGHEARYGAIGLQALYPPNPIAQTLQALQHSSQSVQVPPETVLNDSNTLQTSYSASAVVYPLPSVQSNPNIQVSNTPQGA